jgi:hypothetical protein
VGTVFDGEAGEGIEVPRIGGGSFTAEGGGGQAWPTGNNDQGSPINPHSPFAPPANEYHFPIDQADIGGLQFDHYPVAVPNVTCTAKVPSAPGGGGGYGLDGTESLTVGEIEPDNANANIFFDFPPEGAGGLSGGLLTGGVTKQDILSLDPEDGLLRGGSGGGGGGAHLVMTRSTGFGSGILEGCHWVVPPPFTIDAVMEWYSHHSAAGGGGGGGALQLQSGFLTRLDGIIYANGGNGGSRPPANQNPVGLAQAGGGGSGGAVLLQGPLITVSLLPGRIDYGGGTGGEGVFINNPSMGGEGGPGIVRLEADLASLPDPAEIGASITPSAADLGPTNIQEVLSIEEWMAAPSGPGALSGALSCWYQPPGNYVELEFVDDVGGSLGWDLQLKLVGIPNSLSYRDPSQGPWPGLSWQEFTGGNGTLDPTGDPLLVGPALMVRFQGAKLVGTLTTPCGVELYGANADIVPGSLTGWVNHPSELNDFYASSALRPNIIRFSVYWDRSKPGFAEIEGIESLEILTDPD